MDGDDLMEPKRLEIQVDHLDKNTKVGLVASQVEPFPKAIKNQRKGYELYVQWTNEILTPEEHSMNRFVDCPFAHPSIIFRRSLIDCYGGYAKGILPEDFELWLRWMGHGVVMEKLPQVLLKWKGSSQTSFPNEFRLYSFRISKSQSQVFTQVVGRRI